MSVADWLSETEPGRWADSLALIGNERVRALLQNCRDEGGGDRDAFCDKLQELLITYQEDVSRPMHAAILFF